MTMALKGWSPMKSASDSRGRHVAALTSALVRIERVIVPHLYFEETKLRMLEAIETDPLVLLVGAAGVGKEALIRDVVKEMNEPVSHKPRYLNAAVLVAPTPHELEFSWKALWVEILDALHDPLPERKADRTPIEARNGRRRVQTHPGSEAVLRRSAYSAIRDRRLKLLVIDEALALMQSGKGRKLLDQFDILRNMASQLNCGIVLASTARILEELEFSSELARRMHEIEFPRYRFKGGRRVEEFQSFQRVVGTLLGYLPEEWRPKFNTRQIRLLHGGSVGCVGNLVKWFQRAIRRCLYAGDETLDWSHFEATVLTDKKLAEMKSAAEKGEKKYLEFNQRTFGGVLEQNDSSETVTQEPASTPSDVRTDARKKRGGRVGKPKPSRPQVKSA